PGPDLDNPMGDAARILGLGARIDVLVGDGRNSGGKPDILIEGHNLDDPNVPGAGGAAPVAVADRIAFDVRNFAGVPSGDFPFAPLTAYNGSDHVDPATDPRTAAGSFHNYVKLNSDSGLGRTLIQGDVPDGRRIALSPAPCDPSDQRFQDPSLYPSTSAPSYTCVRADVAPGDPLGLAIRTLSPGTAGAPNQVTSVEDGLLNTVPAGAGG